jgi:hypothetical protein
MSAEERQLEQEKVFSDSLASSDRIRQALEELRAVLKSERELAVKQAESNAKRNAAVNHRG